MKRFIKSTASTMAVALMLALSVLGQEQTGRMEGEVKDQTGAVVAGATVVVESSGTTTQIRRQVVSGPQGQFTLTELPPGLYTVTSEAGSGFARKTVQNVRVEIGSTTRLALDVAPGTAEVVVDVSSTDTAVVDSSGSQVQTNINRQTIETVPAGTSFSSLLRLAPAARPEAKSGGIQIDGASGSENSFIVDGQDVSNFKSNNLDGVNDIPTALVQELSVKSSGFDAEFGGATGGVINVVTKGGTNTYRGNFGMDFVTPKLNAEPRIGLTRFAATAANPRNVAEYVQPQRADGTDFFPSATFSGPVIKDRVYFLGSYNRQIFNTGYTANFFTNEAAAFRTLTARERYDAKTTFEYAFARIDANPLNNLRLSSSFLWNPQINEGNLPGSNVFSGQQSATFNGITYRGSELLSRQGGRVNSNNFNVAGFYTPTSITSFTGRYSRAFQNNRANSYFVPQAPQYQCVSLTGVLGTTTPAAAGCNTGFLNFGTNRTTVKEVSVKEIYEGDAQIIVNNFGGSHAFKGGYQRSKIFTDIDGGGNGSNVPFGTIQLYYGRSITQGTGPVPGVTDEPGAIGYGRISRFGQVAKGSNLNQGVYIQDKWQPIRRLTLNLGVRFEKEFIPTFNGVPIQVAYGWGDKIAPRIGGAFDVLGNGKSKIFASYGKFYDRLKFELPAGSFGGDFFRRYFFSIRPGERYDSFTIASVIGPSYNNATPSCPSTQPSRVRCEFDLRVPSFAATDLKPFQQREFTVGYEQEMFRNYLFSFRYTNKEVVNAVEDAGNFDSQGNEVYRIVNPCKGQHLEIIRAAGVARCTEAERTYNAGVFTLERRLTNGIYFNANYTYSRLFGNYSGLASSDEAGRDDPNVSRYFDIPIQGFAVGTGQPDNGLLATDRPHVFNLYGAYTFDWQRFFDSKNNETTLSLFTTAQSGTPITTTIEFLANEVIYNGRGDLGRTETFTQSDVSLLHRYKFGRDNRYSMVFSGTVNNVLNEHNVTDLFRLITDAGIDISAGQVGFADTPSAINAAITNGLGTQFRNFLNANPTSIDPRYGRPNAFQGARNVRFGFRFEF